jgi:HTH-type transcriptional regulator/antitoxin HigA
MKTAKDLVPMAATHPGEILLDELKARGIKQIKLAKESGLHKTMVNEIISGKRDISATVALKLESILGVSAEYWAIAQATYNIDVARITQKKA